MILSFKKREMESLDFERGEFSHHIYLMCYSCRNSLWGRIHGYSGFHSCGIAVNHMICSTTKATHQVGVSAGYVYSHLLWIGLGQYIQMGALNKTGSEWWKTGFHMEGTYIEILN